MASPLISVMVPVYNKSQYIGDCLDSLTEQTMDDFEIVCVDDGSTDNSLKILEGYQKMDSRIKILRHKENRGIAQARKTAFIAAEGEYIAFVDADDIAEPKMLEILYTLAHNGEVDFVQCCAQVYDPEGLLSDDRRTSFNNALSKSSDLSLKDNEIFANVGKNIKPNLWLSLIKKHIYKNIIKFINDVTPSGSEDNLFIFYFSYFSKNFISSNEIIYNYRANLTSSNLTEINFDLARQQIHIRAAAITQAKWFAEENSILWKDNDLPFSIFTHDLISYAAHFIDRYAESGGTQIKELIKIFGDNFGGYGLNYFLDPVVNSNGQLIRPKELLAELEGIRGSYSWRITKPLRFLLAKLKL